MIPTVLRALGRNQGRVVAWTILAGVGLSLVAFSAGLSDTWIGVPLVISALALLVGIALMIIYAVRVLIEIIGYMRRRKNRTQ